MKFLKGLLLTIVAIIAIYLLLAIFMPSTYNVSRELTIDAPRSAVWNQMNDFKKWANWSAWSEMDSTIKNTYEGNDGEIGSVSSWTSDNSGTGKMTLTETVENEKFGYDLEFIAPWESQSKGYISLEEVEGKTKATFCDEGAIPFLFRPMAAVTGMFDKMMGAQFEKGLENLGKLAVSATETNPVEISQTDFPATSYLGIRHKTSTTEVMKQEFFSTNYGKIFGKTTSDNIAIAGKSSCVYYYFSFEDSTADAMPCVPVSGLDKAPDGMDLVTIPACKTVKATYYGPFSGGAAAHYKIDEYCKANNIKTGLVIEEYVNAATAVSEADYITNIYYLIEE